MLTKAIERQTQTTWWVAVLMSGETSSVLFKQVHGDHLEAGKPGSPRT